MNPSNSGPHGHNAAVQCSSKKMDWPTPRKLFDLINAKHRLTLDICATPENAKLGEFVTEEMDALADDWTQAYGKHRIWMNPPYGRELPKWMARADRFARSGGYIVALVPARVSSRWFLEFASPWHVTFLIGRIRFDGAADYAPFPSALIEMCEDVQPGVTYRNAHTFNIEQPTRLDD